MRSNTRMWSNQVLIRSPPSSINQLSLGSLTLWEWWNFQQVGHSRRGSHQWIAPLNRCWGSKSFLSLSLPGYLMYEVERPPLPYTPSSVLYFYGAKVTGWAPWTDSSETVSLDKTFFLWRRLISGTCYSKWWWLPCNTIHQMAQIKHPTTHKLLRDSGTCVFSTPRFATSWGCLCKSPKVTTTFQSYHIK